MHDADQDLASAFVDASISADQEPSETDQFISWLDRELTNLFENLATPTHLEPVREAASDLCDKVAHTGDGFDEEDKNRIGIEKDKLLGPRFRAVFLRDNCVHSGLFYTTQLSEDEAEYLYAAFEKIVAFVCGKTPYIRERIAAELRGTLGDYLSIRGIPTSPVPPARHAGEDREGPVPDDSFRHRLVTHKGLTAKPWLLINHLWNATNKTAKYEDLAEPVWREHGKTVTQSMVNGLQTTANSFFKRHAIPYKVTTSSVTQIVKLKSLPEKISKK